MPATDNQKIIPLPALDAVRRPIAEASGIPNQAYNSHELFLFERDNVMAKTWAAVAFTSELPQDGYAKPVDFMGLPLVIMRGRNGDYKVFHNVCSHRGMKLVKEETAVAATICCSYHCWTYDLDGNLVRTPHIGGIDKHSVDGFTREKLGLKSIRSATWMGMVFVNLSADAEEFDHFIAPLVARWEAFTGNGGIEKVKTASTGSKTELTVRANWKLAVENYCEAYHLPWIHPALNTYSPLDQHYNVIVNENMSGQGSHAYNLSDVSGVRLPGFEDWPQDKLRQAEYISLFPNVLLGIQADHAFAVILQPLSCDATLEKMEIFYVGDAALGDEYEAARSAVLESWCIVFGEDVSAVEGMQAGRNSPGFNGGVFSPALDNPTHHFHQWIANRYASG